MSEVTNVLLVEDNESLRLLMRIHLIRAGYVVFEAADGEEALAVLDRAPVHLMIVDVMMPKIDGYELTAELRNSKLTLPVLIVTARETLADKRAGFRSGADDYMVKPINFEEMLLRVGALLRRSNIAKQHILTVGNAVLDQESLTVTIGTTVTVLPQKEFLLLHMLLSYPNKTFTRQTVMDEIWGYDCETDPRTVDVHVKRLRDKFSLCDHFEIQTVRGLGYRAVVHS